MWLYNNTMSYPPSSGPVTFDVGVYLFPQAIELAHAGIYTYTVTTTAGTASVEFAVQVIGKSVCLSVWLSAHLFCCLMYACLSV